MNQIKADNIKLGKNVIISPSAIIRGVNGNAKNIVIGDNTYIGDNVQIIIDDLEIGDYCKIHHHTNIHGYNPLKMGHNAWVGQGTIIDSIGGVEIGNNCGIGAYSQLWSHIKYGDPLIGCNYNGNKKLKIGNDVWFVGHCIVSPIIAEDRSMALVGSVVTKDMKSDHIYGGSPAKDLSDIIKPQFTDISIAKKLDIMNQFDIPDDVVLIGHSYEIKDTNKSYFNIMDRTYTKRNTDSEIRFMRALQSKLIKFVPKS
jgi:acetyltransferase-like isoleucine patch superfamily enzyme